jgi:hypothetical protein
MISNLGNHNQEHPMYIEEVTCGSVDLHGNSAELVPVDVNIVVADVDGGPSTVVYVPSLRSRGHSGMNRQVLQQRCCVFLLSVHGVLRLLRSSVLPGGPVPGKMKSYPIGAVFIILR